MHQQPEANRAGLAQLPCVVEQLSSWVSVRLSGDLTELIGVAVPLVVLANGPFLEQSVLFNALNFNFPIATSRRLACALLAIL